jgi:hypothetical protein
VSATTTLAVPESQTGSGSVTAVAVLAIIASGSLGLWSLFLIPSLLEPASRLVQVAGWIVGGLFLLLSAFGLVTAFGLLNRRKWACVSAIVWAICLTQPDVSGVAAKRDAVALGSDLAVIVIAYWALFVLVRPRTDGQFFDSSEKSHLPPVVSAIGWLLALSVIDIPFCLALHLPFFLFGHSLFGWPGELAHVLTSLLMFIAGVALLRVMSFGIRFAVGVLAFQICDELLNNFSTTVQTQSNYVISDILAKFNIPYHGIAGPNGWELIASLLTTFVMAACLVGYSRRYRTAAAARVGLASIEDA